MTNYEKYAGTPERFAEFLAELENEGGPEDDLSNQYCLGACGREGEEAACTAQRQRRCILAWLNGGTQGE